MKIYIDVTVLTMATFITGIQRVTRELTVRLIQSREHEVVLLHYNASGDVYYRINNDAFVDYYTENKGIKEKMITKEVVGLSQISEGTIFLDLDAAWMCRMKRSYLLPILKQQGARIIAHIYDIISITHPQYCLQRGVYNFMDFLGAHLQYADAFVVNAQATVEELEKLAARLDCELPEISVIPLGADFQEQKTIQEEEISGKLVQLAKSKPFILMVGTIEPRKNHKLLLEAYDKSLKQLGYNIVMAGYMGWNMEAFEQKLKTHPDYGKGVYHLEGLNDTEITYLYQQAKCLVFASYTEGFGLPIIEALQKGTPVVAADVPVLREVGNEMCLWFEQDNVEDLVEKIALSERSDSKVQLNINTWEYSAKRLSKVLGNEE